MASRKEKFKHESEQLAVASEVSKVIKTRDALGMFDLYERIKGITFNLRPAQLKPEFIAKNPIHQYLTQPDAIWIPDIKIGEEILVFSFYHATNRGFVELLSPKRLSPHKTAVAGFNITRSTGLTDSEDTNEVEIEFPEDEILESKLRINISELIGISVT